MPKLGGSQTEELELNVVNLAAASGYHFSAVDIDSLGATEYTLAVITCDVSGSVAQYKQEMESCLQEILQSCQKSQRSENLMMRLVAFNDQVQELHGFRLLSTIDPSEYANALRCVGATALYDSTYLSLESVAEYGKILSEQDFNVNAICFVITDGDDNRSKFTPERIAELKKQILQNEHLESVLIILVGVNIQDNYMAGRLQEFKDNANLDGFVQIDDASAKSLAKLAQWVSQSISSQSKALGSGQSTSVSF